VRLVAAAALLLAAAEAAAHAELVGSRPADGAALAASPAQVELVFNEPVRLLSLRLVGASGQTVTLGAPRAEGNAVRARIEATLADGPYYLSYGITSLDSHPVAGTIAFGVGAGPPLPVAAAGVLDPIRVAVRALRDLALLLAAGAALFVLAVGAFPGQRPLLVAAAAVGATCALAGVALQGTGLHSSFALSAGVACAGLACVSAGSMSGRKALLGAGAALALASLPLTGHAVGSASAMAALAAHGLGAAFWLGSLAALLALLRRGGASAALRRFSGLGVIAVALILACGVVLAVLRLDSLDALWNAAYGRLILVKMALLAALIALALVNRYRLLPALERGAETAERSLRRTLLAELGLLAAVIAVTAALVQTAPRPATRELVLDSAGRTATVSITQRSVRVDLRDRQGAPLDAAEVTLELANPATGVQALLRPMQHVGVAQYHYEGESFLSAGWRVTVHARVGDFDKVTFGQPQHGHAGH
jgi:copper transport protein